MSAETTHKVSLGCSTLILIALIVLCFGNMAGEDIADQVQHLDNRVQTLESAVLDQTDTIRELQTSIESLRQELMKETGKETENVPSGQ
jgi:peptidoglycan hydrolase CwlO-like protein